MFCSRRLDGHRFEAGRGRLAHLVNAYLDEMSKAVIGLVGHVLKKLRDGLMALFRYDAAQENDAERTARHFDERGDKIERKKEFEARLSVRATTAPAVDFFPAAGAVEAAARPASTGTEAAGNSTLNRSTLRCPPWPSRPRALRRSPSRAPPHRQCGPSIVSSRAFYFPRRRARPPHWPHT